MFMDETELIFKYKKGINSIINKNFYYYTKINNIYEDMFQEGCIALLKANRTFKEEGSAKFETYAFKCIKNQLCDYIKYNTRRKRNDNETISIYEKIGGDNEEDRELYETIGEEDDLSFLNNEEIVDFIKKDKYMYNIIILLQKGYSQAEIGKIMKVDRRCINNKVVKLRKQLKEEYNICYEKNNLKTNGELIAFNEDGFEMRFKSIEECSKHTTIERSTIRKICQHKKSFYSAFSKSLNIKLKFEWSENYEKVTQLHA